MPATEPIVRRASTASSVVSIPTPLRAADLHALQGVNSKNIAKLERSAEEMSTGGSDIGEEIRRMNELERRPGRQSSIQSSHHGDISVVRPSVMERMGSTRSSRANSYGKGGIVDVNGAARWGGYSPGGYVTSPVGSVSGSWSHPSLSRVTSGSRPSRLRQTSEPMQEGRPLDSPLRPSFSASETGEEQGHQVHSPLQAEFVGLAPGQEHSREPSGSSFAARYDEIAGEIQESLQHVPPSPPKHEVPLDSNRHQSVHLEIEGTATPPDRPRSTDTFQEAQIAFQDFDGVHFSPTTEEIVEVDEEGHEVRRVSARTSSGGLSIEAASLLRTPRARPSSFVPPPPEDGMVYYPAPIPKMLNLPKRLSQLPNANQAKRRSQMLSELGPEARAAGPWLSHENFDDTTPRKSGHHSRGSGSSGTLPRGFFNERMSGNMSNLPPQLRANMFFDQKPVVQDIEMQGGSAVATLDNILAASATAPVNAFTDHPFAGDVRKAVYSHDAGDRKSMAAIDSSPKREKIKKRRSSSIGGLFGRSKSDDVTTTLNKKASRTSLLTDLGLDNAGGNKLKKRRSMMSLGDDLERESQAVKTPGTELAEPDFQSGLVAAAQTTISPLEERRKSRPVTAMSTSRLEGEEVEAEFKEEDDDDNDDDDVEEGEPMFVQPSTLLAELQVRKAQMKSRNRTAATAYPKGMHSTLLQLDAVEEINKRKRKNQRIALAWEDPHQRALEADPDEADEDVPLGMLFPSKDGRTNRRVGDGKDWDRPLGLMEKRELEDNEPLSNRRNRLRGTSPSKGRSSPKIGTMQNASQAHLPEQAENAGEGAADEEEEDETLGQRMRRMKTKGALDGAISDVAQTNADRPNSTFADDLLSQFGGLDVKDSAQDGGAGPQPKPEGSPAPEDETLGQRRARLQREREANGEQRNISDGSNRPPLKTGASLGTLLSANPVGQRNAGKAYQPAQGTLLHASGQVQDKQKNQITNTNMRSSSHHLDKPLVDAKQQNAQGPNTGSLLAMEEQNRGVAAGGFSAYNNGMGGIQLQQASANQQALGVNGANPYFASQTAMPYAAYGQGMMGYPQMQQMQMPMQMQMQPQYYQQAGMNPYVYNSGAAGAGMMGSGFMGNGYNPGMMGGTYASYAQNMGGNMGMGVDEQMTNTQRAAIDRWLMGT